MSENNKWDIRAYFRGYSERGVYSQRQSPFRALSLCCIRLFFITDAVHISQSAGLIVFVGNTVHIS